MIWFAVWICIKCLGLGVYLAKHGQPKKGKYGFFAMLFAVLVDWSIMYAWGAFDHIIAGVTP